MAMKLLDIVKDKPWPAGAVCVVQDSDGEVKWLPSMPSGGWSGASSSTPDHDGDWWHRGMDGRTVSTPAPNLPRLFADLAEDFTTAIITHAVWMENNQKGEQS